MGRPKPVSRVHQTRAPSIRIYVRLLFGLRWTNGQFPRIVISCIKVALFVIWFWSRSVNGLNIDNFKTVRFCCHLRISPNIGACVSLGESVQTTSIHRYTAQFLIHTRSWTNASFLCVIIGVIAMWGQLALRCSGGYLIVLMCAENLAQLL